MVSPIWDPLQSSDWDKEPYSSHYYLRIKKYLLIIYLYFVYQNISINNLKIF